MIEVFIHKLRLNDFKKGERVPVKFSFANQDDVKLLINVDEIDIMHNDSAALLYIRRKSFFKRLFKKSKKM